MRATKTLTALLALAVLAGCAPPLPDSGQQGAGFDSPAQAAQRREAQLTGQAPLSPPATIQAPPAGSTIAGGPSTTQTEAEHLASDTRAALGRPETPDGFVNPVEAPAPLPPSAASAGQTDLNLDRDNPAISREQDFEAVAARRDIEADAERLRAAREQYQLVTPTELQRPEDSGPNIFAYAIGPAKPVGAAAYRRGFGASERRAAEKCRGYRSDNIAQEDFLASGGPERDRLGLDPDGDGNACGWDPAVVRNLVRSN